LLTGVKYDVVNKALAEHRLQKLQEKLRRDTERGDIAAVDHDVHCIDRVKYRIAIDEWLIRWNSLHYPDFYPIWTDEVSAAAIAQAAQPTQVPNPQWPPLTSGPMAAAPTIPITIINAEPAGDGITFAIDGITRRAPAGSRQELAVAPNSHISYDSGGSLGERR
jgi:hypothetical protein